MTAAFKYPNINNLGTCRAGFKPALQKLSFFEENSVSSLLNSHFSARRPE